MSRRSADLLARYHKNTLLVPFWRGPSCIFTCHWDGRTCLLNKFLVSLFPSDISGTVVWAAVLQVMVLTFLCGEQFLKYCPNLALLWVSLGCEGPKQLRGRHLYPLECCSREWQKSGLLGRNHDEKMSPQNLLYQDRFHVWLGWN